MKILVTRPEEDAADTVRRLDEMGHQAVVAPVLDIRFRTDSRIDSDGVQAWLATSRNGVRALVHACVARQIPLLAVGRSTAELARDAGFEQVHDADGDVGDLIALAAHTLDPANGRLFHAAGKEVAGNLAGDLQARGFDVERRVLYTAEPVAALDDRVVSAIAGRQIDAALFFSARSAGVFASLALGNAGLSLALGQMTAICIGERAARELDGLGFSAVRVAARPNQDALLAELASH